MDVYSVRDGMLPGGGKCSALQEERASAKCSVIANDKPAATEDCAARVGIAIVYGEGTSADFFEIARTPNFATSSTQGVVMALAVVESRRPKLNTLR